MGNPLLYHGSLGIAGISLSLVGMANASGDYTVSAVLMAVGGLGVAVVSTYAIILGDAYIFMWTPWIVWLGIVAAVMALIGAVLLNAPMPVMRFLRASGMPVP